VLVGADNQAIRYGRNSQQQQLVVCPNTVVLWFCWWVLMLKPSVTDATIACVASSLVIASADGADMFCCALILLVGADNPAIS
jgi:hypothetical protein